LRQDASGRGSGLPAHSRSQWHRVGYIGGKTANPTYKEVCTDTTGHAEAVEVDYDPAKTPYSSLLKVFWRITTPRRFNAGPDVGTQYRTAIFFHSPEQEAEARASKEELEKSKRFSARSLRRLSRRTFYEAEDYHQQYLEKRAWRPAISSNSFTRDTEEIWLGFLRASVSPVVSCFFGA